MPFALIPFMLLALPILEIAVFIVVGNLIGLWPTLAIVLLTAIAGTLLLRRQGFATLNRIREETRAGRLPGQELVNGVMILAAGILLLTPGLVSDTIGFLLFVPAIRNAAWRFLRSRIVVVANSRTGAWRPSPEPHAGSRPDVVDLTGAEWSRRPDPTSPWHGSDKDGGPGPTLH